MHKTVFEAVSALHLMPPRLVHAGGTAISSFREEGHRCARPGSRRIRRYAKRMTASSSLLLGGLLFAPLPSRAETISFDEMLRGVTVTQQHCAGTPDTVWVTPFGQGVCMRYYFSDAGGRGTRAVVYVPGDKPGIVPESSKYGDPKFAKDTDINKLLRHAQKISQTTAMPAIHLARMGVDGSSGSHRNRKTQLELQATNLALDAIKRRYGFHGFDIFGQSGGSTVTAGLLSVRHDIGCAVLGSGQLSGHRGHAGSSTAAGWIRPFDAVRNTSARILVVTDRNDQVVAREKQDAFVQHLNAAGRQVAQFYVTAVGERHHSTSHHSLFVMTQCLHDRGDREITERLRRFTADGIKHAPSPDPVEPIGKKGVAWAVPTVPATPNHDPICVQGSWVQASNDRRYVCLSWYFKGYLYAPNEIDEVLTQRSQAR